MTVLAVDLAAKYSAACLMNENYQVIDQFDSWQVTEEQFIYNLVGPWLGAFREPAAKDYKVDVDLDNGPVTVTVTHLLTGQSVTRTGRSQLRATSDAMWNLRMQVEQWPDAMVVEDLPHGLKYSTLIKTVCRLQGRIVQAMHEMPNGQTEDVLFVAPAEWRRHFTGLERGTGPEAVVPVAAEFGYVPPDLTDRIEGVKGGKAIARKVQTDYCSAYLIARWAIDAKKKYDTYDIVGTSRYDTGVIRKKDFSDQDS